MDGKGTNPFAPPPADAAHQQDLNTPMGEPQPSAPAAAHQQEQQTPMGEPQPSAPAAGAAHQQEQQTPMGEPQPAAPAAAQKEQQPQPTASKKWGTRQMGPPAAPGAHPENQQAAQWTAARGDQELPPYVITGEALPAAAARRSERDGPMEHILDFFNSWSRKAEDLASSIWLNLKTAPSMSDAAMGKLSLGAKAFTEGGFDKLYKQTFGSGADEQVKKTFACYLSTATGPVAGTLYLTNANVAFCSDRPLSFPAPSGQTSWSYYKVMIPISKIAAVEPVTMKENPPEKYVHVLTVDSHDFWFMGFVSYDKAVHNLVEAVSSQHGAPAAGATVAGSNSK